MYAYILRKRSFNRFHFADTEFDSLGQVIFLLNTSSEVRPALFILDIVQAYINALIGMDLLYLESLTPDTLTSCLSKSISIEGPDYEKKEIY